jgi:hypothetical protein
MDVSGMAQRRQERVFKADLRVRPCALDFSMR